MMNAYITAFIGLANIIAILLVYYSFGKDFDKSKRIIDTMIAVGIMYIIVLITYLLSSIGLSKFEGSETAKTMMIMAFVPVNTILFVPFLIHSYMKTKNGALDIENLNKIAIVVIIIAIIIIISEFSYFRNSQKNIINSVQAKNQLKNSTNIETNIENSIGENSQQNEITNILNETIKNTTK